MVAGKLIVLEAGGDQLTNEQGPDAQSDMLEPVTVRINDGPPMTAVSGERLVMVNAGSAKAAGESAKASESAASRRGEVISSGPPDGFRPAHVSWRLV